MTVTLEQRLRARLEEFVLPQTGRALGGRGSPFTIDSSAAGFCVRVRLGFPAERSRDAIADALAEHCRGAVEAPVTVEIDWSVETHTVQRGLEPIKGVKNIVAVASGKGGVGKSTVAVNVALALAVEGARVGLLDADIYGPSQPRMLGLMGKRPQSRDGKTIEPLEAHGVKAMSIGFLVDERQPMAWRGPMVTSALNQLLGQTSWGELDYLVVDMPPGTGDIQLTLAQRVPVSGAVIVTTPQDIALADARKGIEMFRKVNVAVLGIVENMSLHVCSNCGHREPIFGEHGAERLSAEYGVPVLGALPLDRRIREETDSGTPSAITAPDGPVGSAFRAVALRAAGELAVSGKDYSRLFPKITVEE
ncbi:MAG TPA: iron-sulfur cluster carrier protein ApbC [Gammaproteobacteria bacterium]